MSQPAIVVRDLHKSYRIYERPADVLLERITGKPRHTLFEALKGVSFEVNKGEVMGILGRNGAGKSTLLKVMTGALAPTSGSVEIEGRISQMLELGTGFDPELSGAENIFLGGFCLGMSRKEIEAKYDDIVRFSELEAFIDKPFRTYSTGMQARLTFAVAIHIDPQVLIIDEWLAVGDARFSMKCYERIRQFREEGATVVFVTHNYSTLTEFCDRGFIMDHGQIVYKGGPADTVYQYSKLMFGETTPAAAPPPPPAPLAPADDDKARAYAAQRDAALNALQHDFSNRFGDGAARIEAIAIHNAEGGLSGVLMSGQKFSIKLHIAVHQHLDDLVIGLFIKDNLGRIITHTSNFCFTEDKRLSDVAAGTTLTVSFDGLMTLAGGYYFVGAAMAKLNAEKYDLINNSVMLQVVGTPNLLTDSVVNVFPELRIEQNQPLESSKA